MHLSPYEFGEMLAGFCNAVRPAHASADHGVTNMLNQILKELHQVSGALDNLTTKLTAMESVGDGMAALLADLSTRIRAADDSEKLNALAADVDAKTGAWAAAVTANTPAAETPVPVTPSEPVADPAPEPTVANPPADTTASPAPTTTAPADTDTSAPTGTETPLPTT